MKTRRIARAGIGVLVLAALSTGGCKKVSRAQYDAALEENAELRDRLVILQGTVQDANSQTGQFENDRQRLTEENARLRGELAAYQTSGNTGFEGISGTSVSRRGDAISVAVAGDVLFDSGSATLKSSAKQSLDTIASVIGGQYSGNPIRVEGYTDTDPIRKSGWKTNERLSAERAMAVEAYLVSKGVPNDRIYSAAFGSSEGRATKKQSRRVEIVVLGA